MEILQNTENKLLGRKEILASMVNEGSTPTRADIKKALAKQLKVNVDLVIVNNVDNPFGSANIKIKAKVYDNKESLNKNARPHMIKRNHIEEPVVEEKVEEAALAPATEEVKEEAPVEETKEE